MIPAEINNPYIIHFDDADDFAYHASFKKGEQEITLSAKKQFTTREQFIKDCNEIKFTNEWQLP